MTNNQFTNPTPISVFETYMGRGLHAKTMKKLHATHKENPDMCLYHGNLTELWLRHWGKRYRISVKAMMYYLEHGKTSALAKSTCGHSDCTNPLHQKEIG